MKQNCEPVKEISIYQLRQILERGQEVKIIDIREKHEFDTGCLPGALFVPIELLEKEAQRIIGDRDTPVVVYCRFGIKSLDAARMLKKLGYENVMSLREGFEGWLAQGFEIVGDSRLSLDQLQRYNRHILLREIGVEGQLKLLNSKVLIVGAGGLGSPCALYLAASGIGTIGIIDDDVVDVSNLQRQVIHRTEDVGRPKVESAKRSIKALNPDVNVLTYKERLTKDKALEIIRNYDIVIDGSDNFPTKYLLNDASYFAGVPDIFAGVFQFEGQISIFDPRNGGPCLRCIFPNPPPVGAVASCREAGILGVVPGILGIFQALEAIKMILGVGNPLKGKFLVFNALEMNTMVFNVRKNPSCKLCGNEPEIQELEEYPDYCESR